MATVLAPARDVERKREEYMAIIRDPNKSDAAKLPAKVGLLETARDTIAKATNREVANRVVNQAIQLIREDPKLSAVDVRSLMTCVHRAAMLDLRLGGLRPEAYVVPLPVRAKRNGEWVTIRTDANLWPSYHGWVSLVRRTDRMGREPIVSSVFEGEEFSATLEDGVLLCKHKADALNANRRSGKDDTILYVWVRWTIDGRPVDVLMSRAEIEAHKNQYSKKPHSGEWNWDTKWREMAEKTVIIASVRRGHVPACFDLAEAGFVDEETAIAPAEEYADVIDGDCSAADDAALLEAPPEAPAASAPAVAPPPQPVDPWRAYVEAIRKAESVRDAGAVYDAFFGPEASYQWNDEQTEGGVAIFNSRKDELRHK